MPNVVVLYGGAGAPRRAADTPIALALTGPRANVLLRLHDISRRMLTRVPDRVTDLLEIAAYVHCADQAVSRGGDTRRAFGADWRRRFRFVVPVREPEYWSSAEVTTALRRMLGFLSEDEFDFDFVQHKDLPPVPPYFDFAGDESSGFQADSVLLFSGGMDSLAGAVGELSAGRRVVLVSHTSAPQIQRRQTYLASELKGRFPGHVLHVPVLVRR